MNLFEGVVARLDERGAACALIGAEALALRGSSRSTLDRDLLTTDPMVLSPSFWEPPPFSGVEIDLRTGDADDPLAGVVRFRAAAERPIDLIVGRDRWQDEILRRSEAMQVGSVRVAVPRTADLILLKLFAGGPQDAWDIVQLLSDADRSSRVAEVEERLSVLPPDARDLWRRIVAS